MKHPVAMENPPFLKLYLQTCLYLHVYIQKKLSSDTDYIGQSKQKVELFLSLIC